MWSRTLLVVALLLLLAVAPAQSAPSMPDPCAIAPNLPFCKA